MKKVAIIVPVYKNVLALSEQVSLNHLRQYCSGYDLFFLHPYGLTFDFDTTDFTPISMDAKYFKNVQSYNKLCLSPEFYRQFIDYEYILIYQLDAYVFKDELAYWCNQGYSYIGAPWIKLSRASRHACSLNKCFAKLGISYRFKNTNKHVFKCTGNGGLSLRNVRDTLAVLESNRLNLLELIKLHHPFHRRYKLRLPFWRTLGLYLKARIKKESIGAILCKEFKGPEDEYFSFLGRLLNKHYNICPPAIANYFAIEINVREGFEEQLAFNNNVKPFGAHACLRPEVIEYWLKHFTFIGLKDQSSREDI